VGEDASSFFNTHATRRRRRRRSSTSRGYYYDGDDSNDEDEYSDDDGDNSEESSANKNTGKKKKKEKKRKARTRGENNNAEGGRKKKKAKKRARKDLDEEGGEGADEEGDGIETQIQRAKIGSRLYVRDGVYEWKVAMLKAKEKRKILVECSRDTKKKQQPKTQQWVTLNDRSVSIKQPIMRMLSFKRLPHEGPAIQKKDILLVKPEDGWDPPLWICEAKEDRTASDKQLQVVWYDKKAKKLIRTRQIDTIELSSIHGSISRPPTAKQVTLLAKELGLY